MKVFLSGEVVNSKECIVCKVVVFDEADIFTAQIADWKHLKRGMNNSEDGVL